MKDIVFDKLSGFEKFIFVLGWISAMNVGFWVALVIVFITRQDQKKYSKFFNPHTFKVPYVFGWIAFSAIIIGFLVAMLLVIFLTHTVVRYA